MNGFTPFLILLIPCIGIFLYELVRWSKENKAKR